MKYVFKQLLRSNVLTLDLGSKTSKEVNFDIQSDRGLS